MRLTFQESYYSMFVILDHLWPAIANKDDMGGLLGAMSPLLWKEREPIDPAIFQEWCEFIKHEIDSDMLLPTIIGFLKWYQHSYGFSFEYAVAELKREADMLDINSLIDMGKKLVAWSREAHND